MDDDLTIGIFPDDFDGPKIIEVDIKIIESVIVPDDCWSILRPPTVRTGWIHIGKRYIFLHRKK